MSNVYLSKNPDSVKGALQDCLRDFQTRVGNVELDRAFAKWFVDLEECVDALTTPENQQTSYRKGLPALVRWSRNAEEGEQFDPADPTRQYGEDDDLLANPTFIR